MKYKQIKPKKIYEQVAETLHEMIRVGEIKPGERLDSVQQLAENFQVGRSAIREALSALRAMGLIEMRQGEGTFVKSYEAQHITFPLSTAILMNQEDIYHLLEVRKIIEAGAAASAAQNRTEEDLFAMGKALEEMAIAHGDGELGERADFKFHLALSAAAHNPLLSSLMDHVSELMIETQKETRRLWLFSKQTTMEKLYEQHLAIYKGIVEKNEEDARLAMLAHLDSVEAILRRYIQESLQH